MEAFNQLRECSLKLELPLEVEHYLLAELEHIQGLEVIPTLLVELYGLLEWVLLMEILFTALQQDTEEQELLCLELMEVLTTEHGQDGFNHKKRR